MSTEQAIAIAMPACLVVGGIAKAVKGYPDRHIPTACAVAGALMVGWMTGWQPQSIIAGFAAGFGATGMNQMYRQLAGGAGNHKSQKEDRET